MTTESDLERHFDDLDAALERDGVDETIEEALRHPEPPRTVYVR